MSATADAREKIDRAIAIVGPNPDGNYSLCMDAYEAKHLQPLRCFLPESAPLLEALEAQSVREASERYLKHDHDSLAHQKLYGRRQFWIPWPLGIALLISVVVMFWSPLALAEWFLDLFGPPPRQTETNALAAKLSMWVPWLICFGLVLTPFLYWLWKPDADYKNWMHSRALAEALRTEHFRRVFDHKPAQPPTDPAWPLLLKLEYFRRWQVAVQDTYFERRRKKHLGREVTAFRFRVGYVIAFLVWFTVMMVAWIASTDEQGVPMILPTGVDAVSGTMSFLQNAEKWNLDRFALNFGLVVGACAAALTYWALLSASRRNAARFEVMEKNFEEIQSVLPAVRLAAAEGREADVRSFVDRVHSTMSLELADWVRLAELDLGNDTTKAWFRHDTDAKSASAPQSTNT